LAVTTDFDSILRSWSHSSINGDGVTQRGLVGPAIKSRNHIDSQKDHSTIFSHFAKYDSDSGAIYHPQPALRKHFNRVASAGRGEKAFVTVGQQIEAGDPLVKLDACALEATRAERQSDMATRQAGSPPLSPAPAAPAPDKNAEGARTSARRGVGQGRGACVFLAASELLTFLRDKSRAAI
jgi:hypothetical protein